MTAEIAIMNKMGIALAADSAVTVRGYGGPKVYNTANKLFMLSKYHPVGIMVYGNGELNEVPWELIIKLYREQLGNERFNTLAEYADNFLTFLSNSNELFTLEQQKKVFNNLIINFYKVMLKKISTQIEQTIVKNGNINDKEIKTITSQFIKNEHKSLTSTRNLFDNQQEWCNETIIVYSKIIDDAIKEVFQKLPITKSSLEKLKEIAAFICCKDCFQAPYSGVVIAGYGDTEFFPSFHSFIIGFIVNGALKYKQEEPQVISYDNPVTIRAFAQSEMVHTFMEGIDPQLEKELTKNIKKFFLGYPRNIVEALTGLSPKEKTILFNELTDISNDLVKNIQNELVNYKLFNHIIPVIQAVEALPKDELAAMAESLVNLTSFKRKVSLDTETVGGPIDVVVISKGDGFVWIKRKHYFDADLNHHYFSNYYSKQKEVE